MKGKSKIILSSVLTAALSASLIAGSTFALFTSESEVNVAITSAKVNVSAEVVKGSVQTKSLQSGYENGEGNVSEYAEVSVDKNFVTLNNIVPGDGIKFELAVTNYSSISVLYKTTVTTTEDTGLFDGLNVSIVPDEGISSTGWTELKAASKADGENLGKVSVEIELPDTGRSEIDNLYNGKTCTIAYMVEAVQANANKPSEIENGVALNVTYDADFVKNAEDAAENIAKANAQLATSYETLANAQAAIKNLYKAEGGPLYYYYNTITSNSAFSRCISKVEYVVYGTVEAGESSIQLGAYNKDAVAVAPEIVLKGGNEGAKLSGVGGISAFVAGSYSFGFARHGSFTVSGIEFTKTTEVTSLTATFNNPDNVDGEFSVTTLIENCTFHNQIQNVPSFDPKQRNAPEHVEIVRGCTFAGTKECTGSYGYFRQGYATKVLFENNSVSGYPRGINVEVQSGERCDVIIRGNVIGGNTVENKNVIQLTTATTFLVANNVIKTENGNAITFHENISNRELEWALIRNNTINAKYFIYNEAGAIEDKVVVIGNAGEIVNAGKQHSGTAESGSPFYLK